MFDAFMPVEKEIFNLVPTSKQTAVSVWHMPVAVCTVLNSWMMDGKIVRNM